MKTTTLDVPERSWPRWLMWHAAMRARALTPRGRYERRVLSMPEVQEGLRQAIKEYDEWKRSL